MPAWTAFGAVVGVVLALLLALSWLTQQSMSGGAGDGDDTAPAGADDPGGTAPDPGARASHADGRLGEPTPRPEATTTEDPAAGVGGREAVAENPEDGGTDGGDGCEGATTRDPPQGLPEGSPAAETLTGGAELSGGALLANVAASQGTFTVVLVLAAVATGVPAAVLGVSWAALGVRPLAVGVALGVGLSAANQGAVALFRRLDVGFSEDLRELLAPETPAGWAGLVLGVLPLVAAFEELLFRAILIGAFSTGFGLDPWLLVVASSVLFAAGHGAQGPGGVVVTGTLGVVLGAAFVVTGSLATVVVAHYLVNLLEFVVHER